MKIENLIIKNYGIIENLDLHLENDSTGNPKPVVFVGKNGSGKTLLLSNIIDSLIEFKRNKYNTLNEVSGNNYFKKGKKDYIKAGSNFSYVNIDFTHNVDTYTYTDAVAHNYEQFRTLNDLSLKNIDYENEHFKTHGFFKKVSNGFDKELEKNIFLYFPVNRYYDPAWSNESEDLKFEDKENLIGKDNKNIIKTNVLKEIEAWILDLVLDKQLYEANFANNQVFLKDQNGVYRPFNGQISIPHSGKNTDLLNLLNKMLTMIYKTKYPKLEYARIGVSKKEAGRKNSIFIKERDSIEIQIAPSFSHLSSGEAIIFSLFGSLLKEYDLLNADGTISLNDITGIVLIDEIDLNLHIEFANEILPQLIKLFPKVQFLMTSHSPFFLLGMKNEFKSNYQLINLPNGENIAEENFDEIEKAYQIFTKGFDDLKNKYNLLEEKLNGITKTLVITEGKTDWKHFKKALNFFKSENQFQKIDIEFLEYDENTLKMSDSELEKLLKTHCKTSRGNKIIGIFDRDEGNGKKYAVQELNDLGNNVFAVSIPQPEFREYHQEGISVEFLYPNEDLFKNNSEDRRLYLTSEFNKIGNLKENSNIRVENSNKVKKYLDNSKEKIVDSEVYNIECKSLALSKEDFALNILNEEEGFENINFDGFKKLFEIILEIESKNII